VTGLESPSTAEVQVAVAVEVHDPVDDHVNVRVDDPEYMLEVARKRASQGS
jgi:hypothetical protein